MSFSTAFPTLTSVKYLIITNSNREKKSNYYLDELFLCFFDLDEPFLAEDFPLHGDSDLFLPSAIIRSEIKTNVDEKT